MALKDHEKYNTIEKIADVLMPAFENARVDVFTLNTKAAITLGKDGFDDEEILNFFKAYKHSNGTRVSFITELGKTCAKGEAPMPIYPSDNPNNSRVRNNEFLGPDCFGQIEISELVVVNSEPDLTPK